MAVTYIGRTALTTDLTVYTWTAHSIGTASADRVVIVHVHGRAGATRTVSGVKIGGVSATIDVQQSGSSAQPSAIARLAVPSGTTADIEVTFSAAMVRADIAVYTITGGTVALSGSGASTNNAAMTANKPASGDWVAVAGGSAGFGSGSCTWSGVTEDYDVTIESASMHSGGHATGTGSGTLTVTPTWSATTNTPVNTVAVYSVTPPSGISGYTFAIWLSSVEVPVTLEGYYSTALGTVVDANAFEVYAAATATRNGFDWPYAASSPWNVPISTDATYESAGATKTATFIAGAGPTGIGQVNCTTYSIACYLATTADPLVTITNTNTGTVYSAYRCPTSATPPAGTDGNVTVVQPDGTVVEIYRFAWTGANTITCTSLDTNTITGTGLVKGIRAADISQMGGLIRLWEVNAVLAGSIECFPHSLALALPATYLGGSAPQYVWPANSRDSALITYSGTIPMGTLLAIPDTVNVETLGLSGLALATARTLQRYGAYVVDKADFATLFCEPPVGSTNAQTIKTAWRNTLMAQMRVVTNSAVSTPGGGTWTGDSSNRLTTIAPAIA